MSEIEEDSRYYAAGEAAFIRRRGTPFLLSPTDFAILKEWRALGVPIEAVEQGIDEAFSRREDRKVVGRINSLAYCRDAVLEAWERRAETALGRGTGRAGGPVDCAGPLEDLAGKLAAVSSRRPDLAGPLEAAVRSVERLRKSGKSAGQIEASLARLDKRLAGALFEALSEEEKAGLDGKVEKLLARARVRLDEETAARTSRAIRRRLLRESLDLPRLTLL